MESEPRWEVVDRGDCHRIVASLEVPVVDGPALGRGEYETTCGVPTDVLAEHRGKEPGHSDRPALACLGRSDVEPACLTHRLRNVNRGGEHVHPIDAECPQFASTEPAVARKVDRGSVAVVDCAGQRVHLLRLEEMCLTGVAITRQRDVRE